MAYKNRNGFSVIVIMLILATLLIGGLSFYFYTTTTTTTGKTVYRIAGSGSAGFALKFWTKRFEEQNPKVALEFIPSADAAIAYRGVVEKSIDIGVASRLPKEEEDNSVFSIMPFAKDAIVLAVNKSVTGVVNLTKEQIIGIWSGTITNWKQVGGLDSKIVIIDREEAESSKKKLRELYLGDAKITPNAIEVHSEGEVFQALESTQGSIGILSSGRVKTSANLMPLKLGGVGIDDVDSGLYLYTRIFYVVTRKDSPKDIKDFIKFLEISKFYREFGLYAP